MNGWSKYFSKTEYCDNLADFHQDGQNRCRPADTLFLGGYSRSSFNDLKKFFVGLFERLWRNIGVVCGKFDFQPGLFLTSRVYRYVRKKTLLITITFEITVDDDPLASQTRDSKRVPFVLFSILLEGRVQFRMKRRKVY